MSKFWEVMSKLRQKQCYFILLCFLRRPTDLLILFAGTNGQDLCLDVTVTAALRRDSIERGAEDEEPCIKGF